MKSFVVLALSTVILCSGCVNPSGGIRRDHSFDISPKGFVVFSGHGDGGGDVVLLDTMRNTRSNLTVTPDYEHSPSFTTRGDCIVYASSSKPGEPSRVFIQPVKGAGRRQITTGLVYDMDPRTSPDGKYIVFARANRQRDYSMGGTTWDDYDIYITETSGAGLRRLTSMKYYGASSPDINRDNTRVIYSADPPGSTDTRIWSIDLKVPSNPPKMLTGGSDCSFSPDGKKIVYISDRGTPYDYEVWIMNADGADEKRLTLTKSYNTRPRFTADGKHVVFMSDRSRNGNMELWQVDTDGKNLRQLAGSESLR